MGTGVYDIPSYEADIYSVFTNKVPHGAYRGAGRPEAAYLLERTMNVLASQLKLDPVKLRRINYIGKEKFPFKTPGGPHLRLCRLRDEHDQGPRGRGLQGAAGRNKGRPGSRRQALRNRLRPGRKTCGSWPRTGPDGGRDDPEGRPESQDQWRTPARAGTCHSDDSGRRRRARRGRRKVHGPARRHGHASLEPDHWRSRSGALTGTAVLLSAWKLKEKMARIAADPLGLYRRTEDGLPGGDDLRREQPEQVAQVRGRREPGLRRGSPAGGDGAHSLRLHRLRPAQLHVPVRDAHRGRRGRQGDRLRKAREVLWNRRLREADQPNARRGAVPGRA